MSKLGHGALAGKKTYVTAALTIIGGIAGYLTGDIALGDALQLISTAFMAGFIRSGVKSDTGNQT